LLIFVAFHLIFN